MTRKVYEGKIRYAQNEITKQLALPFRKNIRPVRVDFKKLVALGINSYAQLWAKTVDDLNSVPGVHI